MKHYRIRHPDTHLLLASIDPITWTAQRDRAMVFCTREAAESARQHLKACKARPARNIFIDANVILQRHPQLAVQVLVERRALPLTQAAVYVHARRKDWDAGRLA